MLLVDIRVDLPSYSRSFAVRVQPSSSVLQVKQEIQRTCPGQPRPEGQRLIWRGRLLLDDETIDNLWKTEPRIVHLAVHPSAWSSLPPEIPQPQTQFQPLPTPAPTPTYNITRNPYAPRPNPAPLRVEFTTPPQRPLMTYVAYMHDKALAALSPDIQPPIEPENLSLCRFVAFQSLERNGWTWPDILDEKFPAPSEGGLLYESTTVDGQPYLRLIESGGSPTPIQEHAFKVLTYTFAILNMTFPTPPPVRSTHSQSMPVPPHVNQLLQQLGLPPMRVANNNANPVVNQNNPVLPEIREIPIRPLLAPFVMLIFRTTLLLYFVAPARKPIFGILILAWMLYEIWQPIRNGLRNGWGRIPENQQRANNGADARQGQPNVQQPNAPPAPGVRAAGDILPRPPVVPGTLDHQAAAIFDTLANMNIQEEERILNASSGTPTAEPGLGHKIITFMGLLVTTLHPAVWNRRRVALRRREGSVRTEANIRNAPPPTDNDSDSAPDQGDNRAAQIHEELRAQYTRRPRWIQRYMERVVAEDWVDDSD